MACRVCSRKSVCSCRVLAAYALTAGIIGPAANTAHLRRAEILAAHRGKVPRQGLQRGTPHPRNHVDNKGKGDDREGKPLDGDVLRW
ncbi:hypothetical protein SDC9_83607 [bioreactor metagenome]|uniref:Uncharacterized protein n=1 Tax=bioreactor metagenome TaxID=1076179 RepID=A0A644ZE66_9ZZZZ